MDLSLLFLSIGFALAARAPLKFLNVLRNVLHDGPVLRDPISDLSFRELIFGAFDLDPGVPRLEPLTRSLFRFPDALDQASDVADFFRSINLSRLTLV